MGVRYVIDCDCCGKLIDEPNVSNTHTYPISLVTDRKSDGAGSMENISEDIYLCYMCMRSALQLFLIHLNYDKSRMWLHDWKKKVGK